MYAISWNNFSVPLAYLILVYSFFFHSFVFLYSNHGNHCVFRISVVGESGLSWPTLYMNFSFSYFNFNQLKSLYTISEANLPRVLLSSGLS